MGMIEAWKSLDSGTRGHLVAMAWTLLVAGIVSAPFLGAAVFNRIPGSDTTEEAAPDPREWRDIGEAACVREAGSGWLVSSRWGGVCYVPSSAGWDGK